MTHIIVFVITLILVLLSIRKLRLENRYHAKANLRWQFEILRGQREILEIIGKVLALLTPIESASELEIFVIIDGQQVRMDKMNLKKGQRVELVVSATAKGKPAKLDGEVQFTLPAGLVIVDDGGKKYLQPSDDAEAGAVVLMADADGDLGEGVKNLHFEAAINILDEDADTLAITFGTPEEIPATT